MLAVVMLVCAVPVGIIGTKAGAVATIPSDALEFNGHYYKAYFSPYTTFIQAKKMCEDIGGHLVTITSPDEQDFIYNNLVKITSTSFYWIGATDSEQEGVWKWITGEPWIYTNWGIDANGDKQPDNSIRTPSEYGGDKDEDYGVIAGTSNQWFKCGFWNDVAITADLKDGMSCSRNNGGYICEWESGEITIKGTLDSYVISVVLDDGKNWVSEVTVSGKKYKVKEEKLTNKRAKSMQGKEVIATIKNGEIIDIRLINDLKVNVVPSLSLSDIEYADGKYKATTSNCNAWVENKFNGTRSLLNYISSDPAFTAEIESVTLTSSSDKLKFKESDKFFHGRIKV